jgi:hypothetical protein
MVPGARHGLNVCPSGLNGWPMKRSCASAVASFKFGGTASGACEIIALGPISLFIPSQFA